MLNIAKVIAATKTVHKSNNSRFLNLSDILANLPVCGIGRLEDHKCVAENLEPSMSSSFKSRFGVRHKKTSLRELQYGAGELG